MTTSVKHIASTQRGAPTINGTAGTLIAALDALFVSGWGVTTALSVTVSGGVATATLTPGETFDRDAVILVAGATPGALNGEARVASTSNTSITWPTSAPDGAATGTITIKYAPQTSWQKLYGATNKAVYRSTHLQSAGHCLRVDDTGTTTARVRGYESMTHVDTGVGPFPTDAQLSGGGYLWKSANANATPVRYRIICDERFVVFAIAAGFSSSASYPASNANGFGDPLPLAAAGDAFSTLLSAGGSGLFSATGAGLCKPIDSNTAANGLIAAPRAVTALGGSALVNPRPFVGVASGASTESGADATLGALPSEVDGQVKYSRMFVRDSGSAKPPRAVVPGVLYIPQSGAASVLADGDTLSGSGDLAGRRLLVLATTSSSYTSNQTGAYLVDITGPWR